ncbi:MAG: AAA family ATPase [Desulfitobacteriaceae bacterium]
MLRFISLTVEDFGPFKGSQTIDFTNEDGVTFIWGNNGRGKTTLLNVFRYALYGKFQNRRGAVVDLTSLSNIESRSEGLYGFKVVLRMNNDGEQYELTRQFKVRTGVTRPIKNDDYEQTVYLKRGTSILSGAESEHILKLIMPEQVSRFFLFDGELLQEYEELLMEGTDIGAKIKDSIEKILGVPVLTNGSTDTEAVLDDYQKAKTKVAQSNKQTEQLGSQIAVIEAEIQEHSAELERMREELTQEQVKRNQLEGEMDQNEHIKGLLGDMKALESSIGEKKARRDALLSAICVVTKDAWRGLIGSKVSTVLSGVQAQVKTLEDKENTQKIAKRFLDDMKAAVDQKHCQLCDQDIDDTLIRKMEERIRDAESEYGGLSTEEAAQLRSLQNRRATLETMQFPSSKDKLEVLEQQLSAVKVEISDDERKLKTVKEELERHGDIEELATGMQERVKELTQVLKKIENLEEGKRLENEKITSARSTLATLNAKLDRTATGADMVRARRRVELCEQIHAIFEEGIGAYRDKLKSDVEKDATDLFVQISNDPDYEKLVINENYGLFMVHKTGEIVPLRSAGFEHVVALSLIGALHKNAPLRGPVIMDSPFGRLDPTHKANITKALPSLSEQIVLLAYTHEIDEQGARATLGASLKKEYRLTRQTSFHTRIEPN